MPLSVEFSIVTARNMGLEKKAREPKNISIEDFLLKVMDLHGLNYSDITNISLEKYLIENGYLTSETLSLIDSISILEKEIFNKKVL